MAASSTAAAAKAKECLAKAVPVPGWPLYNIGKVALLDSKSDFDLLQNAIDYLTCKAKVKMTFTDEEKTFLKDFYSDLALGGKYYLGYSEAGIFLQHYLDGSGTRMKIDAAMYQTSVIVKDTSEAIKDYVRDQIAKKVNLLIVRTTDPASVLHLKLIGFPRDLAATPSCKVTLSIMESFLETSLPSRPTSA